MNTVTASSAPWPALEKRARGADHVTLVAPFIKVDTLRRVLALVSEQAHLTCVTRWQSSDIISGASDVACRTLVADRGGQFLLNQRLHAKYYRFGDSVLVGSANLTASGMGYGSFPNVEILHEPGLGFDPSTFEKQLLSAARVVTDDEFKRWHTFEQLSAFTATVAQSEASSEWRPLTRDPAHVWLAYCGSTAEIVSRDERLRSARDLVALNLPPHLELTVFSTLVAAELLSSAAIADVMLTDTLSDEDAWTELAKKWNTTRRDAQRFRETAWNWIATFLDPEISTTISR